MSALPSSTTGHCHCGKTRYRLRLTNVPSDLALSGYCHCTKCQRLNGAPFIWTTHWESGAVEWVEADEGWKDSTVAAKDEVRAKGGALVIPLNAEQPSIPSARFSSAMTIFETMQGRKWKQRCSTCGTPMGSWNEAKKRWSIWPSTLSRDYQPTDGSPPSPEGDIHPAILTAIAPDHHQFYGAWRMMAINDSLPKWEGYKGQSTRVS